MFQRGLNSYLNIPAVTKNLIIINALFWLATVIMADKFDLTNLLGLHWPASNDFRPYQFVTYMFMHGSLTHLFFNMFAAFMFGRVLESCWGGKRFLIYYMITGVGAGAFNMLITWLRIESLMVNMDGESIEFVYQNGAEILRQGKNYTNESLGALNLLVNSTTIGASGSVFGVLLAFGMMFPNVGMYIIPIPFPVKAKYMVIGYGVIEFFAGFADFDFDHVAHFAHLGGMFFGVMLVLYWRNKDRRNGNYFQ